VRLDFHDLAEVWCVDHETVADVEPDMVDTSSWVAVEDEVARKQ